MKKNKLLFLLGVVVVIFLGVLGFLLWNSHLQFGITTQSTVPGVSLNINDRQSLIYYLEKDGVFRRTNWEYVTGSKSYKQVTSMKVIYTDQYLWGEKKYDSPNVFSSTLQIVNDQLVVTIQVGGTTPEELNTNFQREFIRAMANPDDYSAQYFYKGDSLFILK